LPFFSYFTALFNFEGFVLGRLLFTKNLLNVLREEKIMNSEIPFLQICVEKPCITSKPISEPKHLNFQRSCCY